ncbi:FprA family A-type flavoprotein [Clostridium botulinum]|uniref:FprA family A-type flavoprotein n=1 Tax=Clostridium TaxID=1485 RepID=UPI000507BCAD|nr:MULTISPECIES: FprA family A-type flavoprotein [unclassified Clostridium]KFX60332.1 beta-lactamase [Clostridium botulinum]MBY6803293.1 FprA family A-type flavoprotein [Clostridium botulinum]MBY6813838.1 FprA family A-type flavoprotein [Clostridium botulinum]MBY6820221.1 FprA family A-type flavoprotein [Clostridium botulinum]MBZ9691250.1 FprA family A-type flavoprotein [Clostridium sp. M14]
MFCVRKVTEDLYWIGGNDKRLSLFENIHPIPRGVSYNSYLLLDEKTVLFDTVDWSISRQFIENIQHVLNGRTLDYLVINHMEPDHGASIEEILLRYPNVKIISTEKAFLLMRQFGFNIDGKEEVVKEGDTKSFGKHVVTFIAAPMVHWPEAMVTFDTTNGVLFSADAFGSFGALDGKLFNDEIDFEHEWLDDARRYYTNIVGKYGPHVQSLLKKASGIDIKMICPLHGPVWRTNIGYFIDKYDKWSRYEPEEKAVMIVYASMYGNTESAATVLATKFVEKGVKNVVMYDVSSTHVSKLISETFRVSHVVLASVTYNLGIYPPMHNYLMDMKALNLQKRTFAIIENGSWACKSGKLMHNFLDEMREMTILEDKVTLVSSMKEDNVTDMDELVKSVMESMK